MDLARVELLSIPQDNVEVFLTTDLSAVSEDTDNATALANMLLNGALGGSTEAGTSTFDERLAREKHDINEARARTYASGPFLIIRREGMVPSYSPSSERELDQFIVCFDGIDKSAIRAETEPLVPNVIASLLLATGQVIGADFVTSSIVSFRDDGKPIYSFTFSAQASGFVASPLDAGSISQTNTWYKRLKIDKSLSTVVTLLVTSLQVETDRLRAFLLSWTALETLITKVFPVYENAVLSELTSGGGGGRERYVLRIRNVMKDK